MALAFLSSSVDSARGLIERRFSSSFRASVRDWAQCALDLAFPYPLWLEREPWPINPPFCRQCGMPYPAMQVHESPFTCTECLDRTWHFEWARAGFRTSGQVREAIVGFKYKDKYYRRTHLVRWLTDVYVRFAENGTWDGLVPVPLYHRRYRERGFNQAAELARGLSKFSKLPVLDCLYRCRETVSQVRLERDERWENMLNAFQMKRGFDVTGRHLLLIDDVFTTGATVNACAQILAQAGAARLAVLTVSRS